MYNQSLMEEHSQTEDQLEAHHVSLVAAPAMVAVDPSIDDMNWTVLASMHSAHPIRLKHW